ncbi:MAG: hypothetical protein H6819_03005 [Phycisphaerales bacterium]|nr:hypothetical protein [Phycisphaerales bacterium]MCB9856166.1 hypothetical protein [Phycisphaerales bacterium]
MSSQRVVETLNQLLAAEYASILPRLRQSDPFVSLAAAEDRDTAYGLVQDSERHEKALTDLIMSLRGAPVPVSYDIDTTSYHYVTLEYLMPQIIQGVQSLIAAYSSAGSTNQREADALIARHLGDYQSRLASLEKMHSNLVS